MIIYIYLFRFWSINKNVCAQCPVGWTIYQSHCYYVNTNRMSWSTALTWCRTQGAMLMIVNDNAEFSLLYQFYVQYAGGGHLWVEIIKCVL